MAALLVAMTVRVATLGAYVNDDALKVVGILGAKRVVWGDIERFAILPRGRYSVAHLILDDGRRPLPILAIDAGGSTEKNRRRIQATVDQLNEVLADHRDRMTAQRWRPRSAVNRWVVLSERRRRFPQVLQDEEGGLRRETYRSAVGGDRRPD